MAEIRILGDSSSSGIGRGEICYPYQLFLSCRLRASHDIRIVNYSVPGLTSADAAQLCHSTAFRGRYDHLVVYLGNNERAGSARKGVAGLLHRLLRRTRRSQRTLRPPSAETERFVFCDTPAAPRPITPDEFRKNLILIVGAARRSGAAVILINPVANPRFPAGIHAANGAFFKYVGLSETTGAVLRGSDGESSALVEAIRLHDAARYEQARALYDRVASASSVAGFIARHNRATLSAGPSEASRRLHELLGTRPYYDPIVLYNLYRLCLLQNRPSEAVQFMEEACERDATSYRVTRTYREVVAELARTSGLPQIDLATVLNECDFIDYCHPTAAGHRRIADALTPLLCTLEATAERTGSHEYENRLVSPNTYFEDSDLIGYYQIDHAIPRAAITAALRAILRRAGESREPAKERDLVPHLRRFLLANDIHPAFTPELDLLGRQAPRSHEVLTFPEFFLYRLLMNYGAVFEDRRLAERMGCEEACSRLLHGPSGLERMILRRDGRPLDMDLELGLKYLRSIDSRLSSLVNGPGFANTIDERIKTLGVWYTREAFRYGTQSRLSMLYDRWTLERMAEAVSVAAVIAAHNHLRGRLERYGAVLRQLDEVLSIHERHAALHYRAPDRFSDAVYEGALHRAGSRMRTLLGGTSGWKGGLGRPT